MIKPIHVVIDGRVLCGIKLTDKVLLVRPQKAKFVTCRRCLKSLLKVGS